MLVLTRKPGESLIIGKEKEVEITVISVKRNQVRIGIKAPKNTPIYREELLLKIQPDEAEPTSFKDLKKKNN